MTLWWALAGLALAEPVTVELEPDAFVARGTRGTVSVTRVQFPEGAAGDAAERVCRVRFDATATGPMTPTLVDCPTALQGPTEEALAGWSVSYAAQEGADAAAAVPLEVWIRFGLGAREVPELYVKGDWRAELTLPAGVHDMPLYAAELPRPGFPPQALDEGVLGAECTVDVDVSHRGYPESDPVATDCEPLFAAAVAEAAKRWRFKPPRIGQEPTASSSTLGVVFETVPGSAPGELEGQVRVVVPGTTEKVMLRQAPRMVKSGIPANAVPLLVLDHDPYATVEVMDWVWPELAVEAEERCDMLVQVDPRRRVVVWPETCADGVRDEAVAAVQRWALRPGEVEPGERYGRFRVAMVFAPGAEPHLVVPAADLVSVGDEVKERVHTFQEPVTKSRVPPKMPKGLTGSEECVVTVEVAASGKPAEVTSVSCSDAVFEEAQKAVKQWRWEPAREDGRAVSWTTTVRLKFAGAE